ncbi:LRR domain containing protein [Parasponia andersonii]|uniref:LRR domain containing protein n=1 Tax=Parasponia andersonii TaxID=3476 RepID=A0A2P5DNL2_PARAD|nr:LRR domain containing protein [Parasponia andersonii]
MTSISERIEEPTDANTAFSLFNQKFALPALREINIRSTDNLEKIWEYPWLSTSADHSFRKLEEIYVVGCKNLQKVLPSPMWARRLPNLRYLHICDCEVLQEVFEIERSNSSVEEREATASQLSYLYLNNLSKLKHVWPKDSQGSSHLFQNLKVIYVSNCHNLESLCPPSVAKGLLQLQTLEIRSCDVLKEIISNNDGEEEKETVPHKVVFPQLTSLYLRGLPQLVSFYSVEPQGLSFQEEKSGLIEANYPIKQQQPHSSMDEAAFLILRNIYIGSMDNLKMIWAYTSTVAASFSNLEEIEVSYCKNLEKILPPSMWSSLQKLTKLSIYRCEMVDEVFEIETRSNVEETTPQLRHPELHYLSKLNVWTKDPQDNHMFFQNLKDIELSGCPKLQSLFPPFIAKEWPSLESLEVEECAKVTVLAMKVVSRIIEEEKSGILAPINNQTQKPFFLMEKVTFPKLKRLILTGNIDIPEEFAKVFSSLTESKPFQRPKLLHRLWEDVIQNLETLHLSGCGSLKKLVLSSSVSFQNLTTLMVSKCCGLLNLVTLPIARSLGQKLRSMSILECENMTEIIAQEEEEEGGATEGGEIVFSQLEILILDNLPSLTHFYSGNYMMRFPNLGSATVSKCFEMRSFCIHGVTTHKLDKIFTELPLHLYVDTKFHFDRIEYDDYLRGELWKGDINMTLEELWKTRHNNPLTSIQEDKDSASISDLEEDSEKDSKEDADDEEEDIENDNNHIENFDEDSKMTSKESSEQDSRDIIDKDSEESSKEDSEKDSKEDTDDEEEDIENDNNHIENFDEDSKMTSKEFSEQDSKDDIDEDSEESSEEDSDKKGHLTKEASEKDSEDDFEEKSETDSSESVSETD